MPMKGRFPIRRTLEYLQKGDIIFKNRVKVMTVNYNTNGELSDGARSELTAASGADSQNTADMCEKRVEYHRFLSTDLQTIRANIILSSALHRIHFYCYEVSSI